MGPVDRNISPWAITMQTQYVLDDGVVSANHAKGAAAAVAIADSRR